jgi:hypothetical protein
VKQFVLLIALASIPAYSARVRIEADPGLDAAARHGLSKLTEALRQSGNSVVGTKDAGVTIIAGLTSGPAGQALRSAGGSIPQAEQSLAIRRAPKGRLVLCGADGTGLMYAALDTADRVRWTTGAPDPLRFVKDTSESPYLTERGISMYTMQRAYFESRLYDENHWKRYFDLLAASRINMFTVIFGYENGGFLAPPYPYFFDTPGFPSVRMVGLTRDQQDKNTRAFKAMIASAHERGIRVTAAIWDHIYRGGVQGGGIPGASEQAGRETPGLVTGVMTDNLSAYTKAALRRFMQVFPEVDGLEFRMHTESGLKREEMGAFWHDVFALLKEANPSLRVTLRAKDVPDSIIDDAIAQKLPMRMETKFWMEQMGLPFHPTHINRQNQSERRHGYADLLRYPQRYRVLWRLWSGGSTRLLLWGDPDYVRRYAESARLYDGNSIDVNEMLATKMLGEPHDKAPWPFLNQKYRTGEYEFERYWHFYQAWGRVAYNPQTPSEPWEREFARRFGTAGPELMAGLHEASKVVPRIVAAAYRYQLFPTTRGWAEMQRQGDLPQFAALEGSDTEQFMTPKDEARSLIEGAPTSKRRPEETARWFADTADRILAHVSRVDVSRLNGEGLATVADLKILAWLARYYAERLPAAVSYNLFAQTKNTRALDYAISGEKKAIAAWQQLVASAGDVYSDEVAFGAHAVGFPRNWREELANLRAGLVKLEAQRSGLQGPAAELPKPVRRADSAPPSVILPPAAKARPGQPFTVSLRAEDESGIASIRLRYRHLTQVEDYQTVDMTPDPKTGLYSAAIPGDFITPVWDLIYFVEAIDSAGNGRNYPDLEKGAPYVIMPVMR